MPKKELNRARFRETVKELLGDVTDTDMLAIFTGMMEGKERNEIMAEYGIEEQDFDNTRRRMLYKLKRELSIENLKEYSTENNYLKNLALRKKKSTVLFLTQEKNQKKQGYKYSTKKSAPFHCSGKTRDAQTVSLTAIPLR
jgi:hypothetical protein